MTIDITCDGTDYIDYRKLKPFQGELKTLSDDNLIKLKNSIIKYGFTVPAFVWQNGKGKYILDAHQRMKALQSLFSDGYEIPDIPIIYIQAKDEQEAKEKLLHITSQYGEFTEQGFADFVLDAGLDISELDIRLTDGEFTIVDPNSQEETIGDDEIPEEVEPITKLGDLWELGEHRVLCGDSTDADTVALLMDGQKADMVFTDPPYGMSYGGGRARGDDVLNKDSGGVLIKAHGMIKGDDLTGDDLIHLVRDSIALFFQHKKDGGAGYICFTWRSYTEFEDALNQAGANIKACIVWDKKSIGLGMSNYRPQHEFIFYCKGQWYGDKAQSDVWYMSRGATGEYVHPTQKPIELIEDALHNSSKDDDIVSDAFLGSGSTLIACEKTNRICYGMELDGYYCDVIVNRYKEWCEKNDRTAVIKLNGEVYDITVKIGEVIGA